MLRISAILGVILVSITAHYALALESDSNTIAYFNCMTGEKVASVEDVQSGRVQIAAAGFCELGQYTNGTFYCRQGSCTGSCSLNNFPVSCSCK